MTDLPAPGAMVKRYIVNGGTWLLRDATDPRADDVLVYATDFDSTVAELQRELGILKDNHAQTVENLGAIRTAHFDLQIKQADLQTERDSLQRQVGEMREALEDTLAFLEAPYVRIDIEAQISTIRAALQVKP